MGLFDRFKKKGRENVDINSNEDLNVSDGDSNNNVIYVNFDNLPDDLSKIDSFDVMYSDLSEENRKIMRDALTRKLGDDD